MAVVQSLSCVQLFGAPWTAARQASLSFTISQSLLRLTALGRAEHRSPTGAGGEALHTGAVIPLHTGWQGMRETLIWHLPALLALGWPFVPKSLHGSGREVPQALLGSCSGCSGPLGWTGSRAEPSKSHPPRLAGRRAGCSSTVVTWGGSQSSLD